MGAMASQITSLTSVYSTVHSVADQRKHQTSALLAFVRGIHRWPVNSSHKGPVTRKMFPFDDVIMNWSFASCAHHNVSTPTPNMKSAVSISDHVKQLLLKSYFRTYHSPCAILKYVTYDHSIMNTRIILSGHYSKLRWTITQIGKKTMWFLPTI